MKGEKRVLIVAQPPRRRRPGGVPSFKLAQEVDNKRARKEREERLRKYVKFVLIRT
jgi:hypothetical protein